MCLSGVFESVMLGEVLGKCLHGINKKNNVLQCFFRMVHDSNGSSSRLFHKY